MVSDLQIPECIPCALSCVKHYTEIVEELEFGETLKEIDAKVGNSRTNNELPPVEEK